MNDYGWPDKAESTVRIVHIGDVVGKPGMRIACAAGKWLKQRLRADVAVINAENAADGTGLRVSEYRRLIEAGYDAVTLGDHIYRKREIIEVLQAESNIVKPANFPPTAPGKTWCCVQSSKGVLGSRRQFVGARLYAASGLSVFGDRPSSVGDRLDGARSHRRHACRGNQRQADYGALFGWTSLGGGWNAYACGDGR